MKYAITRTFAYLVVIICGAFVVGDPPTKANEWGDYFAGFVAPVALVWFIATLVLQRKQLAVQSKELATQSEALESQREALDLQREEMKLTRDVLKEQAEMQLKAAEAMREANKISASTLFAESVPRHERLLDDYIVNISKYAPSSFRAKRVNLSCGKPDGVLSTINYFENFEKYELDIENDAINVNFLDAIRAYEQAFLNFHKQAHLADRAIDVAGPYLELWAKIDNFLGKGTDVSDLSA